MKERPILFSGPMVRALMDGRKTQTRRALRPMSKAQAKWLTPELLASVPRVEVGSWDCGFGVSMEHPGGGPLGFIACPYGAPGDRLWVRETWAPCIGVANPHDWRDCFFRASWAKSDPPLVWKPSIHMPRKVSRIMLEVTGVRVERLQAITEDDARAEGVNTEWTTEAGENMSCSAREAFDDLWCSINGPTSWSENPWVWVVQFSVLEVKK